MLSGAEEGGLSEKNRYGTFFFKKGNLAATLSFPFGKQYVLFCSSSPLSFAPFAKVSWFLRPPLLYPGGGGRKGGRVGGGGGKERRDRAHFSSWLPYAA